MTTQKKNKIGVQADHSAQIEEIAKRVDTPAEQWSAETKDQVIEDRKVLLQFVRRQAVQLKSVRRLADESVHRISVEDLVAALEQSLEDTE
jgi:hypothetical protein